MKNHTTIPIHVLARNCLVLTGSLLALVTAATAWAQYSPPMSGLVGWWRGNGDATDSSGHAFNGTMQNGMGFTTGLNGQAFAGNSGQRMYVVDNSSFVLTNSLTIGAWVKPQLGYVALLRGDNRAGFDPYQLTGDNNGHMGIQLTAPNNAVESLFTPIQYGVWQQLTATLDGSTGDLRVYLNGTLAAEEFTAIRPFGLLDSAQSPGIFIGNSNFGADFPLIGAIDEVVLYNRALSPAEVMSLVPEPGSGALYTFGAGLLWVIRRRGCAVK